MKKVLYALLVVSLVLIPPVAGFAQEPPEEIPEGCQDLRCLLDLLDKIANWIFTFLLVIAVIFILLAAYTFLTAGGDPAKVTEARNKVLYAAVGVIIAVAARGIVAVARALME